MGGVQLELDDELVEALRLLDQPVERAARELMVMELYRRREISSGKAARLLGMGRYDFIRYSGELGIPFIDMTEAEWRQEMKVVEDLVRSHPSSRTPVP